MHDVGSLCIFTMCLFNFFLAEKKPPGRSVYSPNPSIPPSPPPLGCLEGIQALLPLLQGPTGQSLGCLLSGIASFSLPQPAPHPPPLSWPVLRIMPKYRTKIMVGLQNASKEPKYWEVPKITRFQDLAPTAQVPDIVILDKSTSPPQDSPAQIDLSLFSLVASYKIWLTRRSSEWAPGHFIMA